MDSSMWSLHGRSIRFGPSISAKAPYTFPGSEPDRS
uniref:Uncharacterized protein n=1 Tax=Anopheles dirus TaxID=7168 RepID=A0A182NWX4_9DIPT